MPPLIKIGLVALVYFLSAKLGLLFAYLNPSVSPIWPPTGMALVTLLLFSRKLWPGIAIGAVWANYQLTGVGWLTAIGIGAGNTLEAVVGAYLVTRFADPKKVCCEVKDYAHFVVLGALLSPLLSAAVGTLSLCLSGHASFEQFVPLLGTWWIGDCVGALLIVPLILSLAALDFRFWTRPRRIELAIYLPLLTVVSGIVYHDWWTGTLPAYLTHAFLIIPFFIWAALRFDRFVQASVVTFVAVIAATGTLQGKGAFIEATANESLLRVQLFIGMMAVTITLLGISVWERKRAHAALEEEIKIREIAQARLLESEQRLRKLAAQLERSNSDLEYFASMASHDLKAPLRAVLSHIQLLAHRYQGKLDAQADGYIQHALEGSKRMVRLIDDLMAFSRVGSKPEPRESVDLNSVLERVMEDLSPSVKEANGTVSWEDLPVISANRSQMGLVFQNLVSNALKYRKPGEPAKVHLHGKSTPSEWSVAISDNGVGIAPEYSQRIFDIFQRFHSEDQVAGSGIGLATCKKVIERLGGKIWVESHVGQGSTFYFNVPRAET